MIHDGDRVTIGTGPRPRVGDGGQSLTIEGKVVNRRSRPELTQTSSESGTSEVTQNAEGKYTVEGPQLILY